MKISAKILLPLLLSLIPISSYGDIYAQSGYEEGQDGILLLTEKCPGSAGEAGFKVAVIRANGNAMQGCYVKNNRGNFVAKWQDGSVAEIPSNIFTIKEQKRANARQPSSSEKKEVVMSDFHDRADTELSTATNEMNAAYKKLMGLLDTKQQAKLKAIQAQWSAFKDQNCQLYSSYVEGGSMQPLVLNSCLTDITKSRTKDLNDFSAAFSQ